MTISDHVTTFVLTKTGWKEIVFIGKDVSGHQESSSICKSLSVMENYYRVGLYHLASS